MDLVEDRELLEVVLDLVEDKELLEVVLDLLEDKDLQVLLLQQVELNYLDSKEHLAEEYTLEKDHIDFDLAQNQYNKDKEDRDLQLELN